MHTYMHALQALKDEVKTNPQALRGASSVFSRDGPTQQRPTSAKNGNGGSHGLSGGAGAGIRCGQRGVALFGARDKFFSAVAGKGSG